MWPFVDKKTKVGLKLAEGYRHKLKVAERCGVDGNSLFGDDYILGYVFGECAVVTMKELGRVSGPTYAEIFYVMLQNLLDKDGALSRIQRVTTCSQVPCAEFDKGQKNGVTMALLMAGMNNREDDSEVMEARLHAPEIAKLDSSLGSTGSLSTDQGAAIYLDQKVFLRLRSAKMGDKNLRLTCVTTLSITARVAPLLRWRSLYGFQ